VAALALAMAAGSSLAATDSGFARVEGLNLNSFVREGDVAAHIVLRNGNDPRLIVAFPAGNSGVGLWFSPLGKPAEWSMSAPATPVTVNDAKGRPLHGVSFQASIHADQLVPKQAVLSSVRVLRDYQGLGTQPAEVVAKPIVQRDSITWSRDRLDGAPGYSLVVKVVHGSLREGSFVAGADGMVTLAFTALTGETPLTPVSGNALLNDRALPDAGARAALEYLSYKEKYLAGSWRFDTYFGRDTLMSVRLLMPALQPAAVETGLRSVLERLSPQGEVAHEEDIGEFAIIDHRRQGDTTSAAPVYDYKMIDSDYLFVPVARAWLLDDPRGRARSKAFLAGTVGGERLGDAMMRNIRFIATQARAFATSPTKANLVSLKPGVPVGEWRDSNDGLGGGRYPYDVNAILVPEALASASELYRSGLLAPYAKPEDKAVLASLASMAAVWQKDAAPLFITHIDADAARKAIQIYADKAGVPARAALAAVDAKGVTFHALSLDAQGHPIAVQNSDDGFALLFGKPSGDQLDTMAAVINRPFPAGLMTPVGMLVANPAFAAGNVQSRFGPGAYHGTVIWSWQQALTAAGLARQLERKDIPAAARNHLRAAQTCLWKAIDATASVQSSELWSWRHAQGKYQVAAFGASGADADESNAAQLWSTVFLAIPEPAPEPGISCPA
jgi:glycogen debranching enzyme